MDKLVYNFKPTTPEQQKQCDMMVQKCKETMKHILDTCPNSREKSLAVTKLEESIMWATAAIVRN